MDSYQNTLAFWQQKKITTTAELAAALNGYVVAFAYHSGKIENEKITYHDTREIFDHDGVSSYTGDLRTLYEIRNSKDASELILNAFGIRRRFDENFLKEVQFELTKNTYDVRRYQIGERPGEYKHHDYVTGREEVGALPEDVPAELSEIIVEVQNLSDKDSLVAAAYFHAKFENIHPFADGNGRTGRLAMNYILITHNHPPIVIHEEDRRLYYAALEVWDTKQELTPLIKFLQHQATKTWVKQIEKQHPHSVDRGR